MPALPGWLTCFAEAGKLSVRTMIIDVEPLVASWRSGTAAMPAFALAASRLGTDADRTMDFRPYWARPAGVTVKSWRQPARP
jgi:hypothetical protein